MAPNGLNVELNQKPTMIGERSPDKTLNLHNH